MTRVAFPFLSIYDVTNWFDATDLELATVQPAAVSIPAKEGGEPYKGVIRFMSTLAPDSQRLQMEIDFLQQNVALASLQVATRVMPVDYTMELTELVQEQHIRRPIIKDGLTVSPTGIDVIALVEYAMTAYVELDGTAAVVDLYKVTRDFEYATEDTLQEWSDEQPLIFAVVKTLSITLALTPKGIVERPEPKPKVSYEEGIEVFLVPVLSTLAKIKEPADKEANKPRLDLLKAYAIIEENLANVYNEDIDGYYLGTAFAHHANMIDSGAIDVPTWVYQYVKDATGDLMVATDFNRVINTGLTDIEKIEVMSEEDAMAEILLLHDTFTDYPSKVKINTFAESLDLKDDEEVDTSHSAYSVLLTVDITDSLTSLPAEPLIASLAEGFYDLFTVVLWDAYGLRVNYSMYSRTNEIEYDDFALTVAGAVAEKAKEHGEESYFQVKWTYAPEDIKVTTDYYEVDLNRMLPWAAVLLLPHVMGLVEVDDDENVDEDRFLLSLDDGVLDFCESPIYSVEQLRHILV